MADPAFLFDLDGTLVDSVYQHVLAWREALEAAGIQLAVWRIHWRGSHPLDGTIAAFEPLQRDGKILSWGVSNFDVDDLDEALSIAGQGRMACNQVVENLVGRDGIEPPTPGFSVLCSTN